MVVIALIESFFYGLAESLCVSKIRAVDMGGSMYVHTFGAYFGVACAIALRPNKE